jgi:uncharacterized protein YwgA
MTSSSARPFTSVLRPRPEVLEGEIVEAVNLANIYIYNELRDKIPITQILKPSSLYDPREFLKRTHFSESIKQVIIKVFGGLAGLTSAYLDERGSTQPISSRVYIIPSHLGGGKTHLLATLYYLARLFNERGIEEVLRYTGVDERVKYALRHALSLVRDKYREIRIVAIVGDTRQLAPSPDNPVEIKGVKIYTPWGLLAYLLGAYQELEASDKSFYAPRVDELVKILHGKSVLILLDEAVEYMELAVRISSTYRDYAESYLSFIRNLAEAVSETPGAVLVATLPAEYIEGRLVPGIQKPEYVDKINSMLTRVSHEYIPPLERRDVIEVFKKRLFENAYSKEVVENASLVKREVESKVSRDSTLAKSVRAKYGDVAGFAISIGNYYPFHPAFIEVLVNIASTIPGLGTTRYLLAYVARLIRYIYESKQRRGRDPPIALITPWLIPLERVEFRTELLRGLSTQNQSEFQRIFEQDVKLQATKIENYIWAMESAPRQAVVDFIKGALAETIWLYTIPGRGMKASIKLYPEINELPAVLYDPLVFRDIPCADVLNAISELKDASTYMTEMEGRLFYALVPDIEKFLRERYLSATDLDALTTLERRFAHASVFRPGRKIKQVIPIVTSKLSEIESQLREVLASTQDPVLFVYLGLSEPPGDLEDVVLTRNNVVLLLPDYNINPRDLGLVYSESLKRITGSEPQTLLEYLKNLLKLYKVVNEIYTSKELLRSEFGDEFFEFIISRLKKIKDDAEKQIVTTIYFSLKTVIMGRQKAKYSIELKPIEEEEIRDLSSLTRLLEDTLEKRGVPTSWTWQDLYNQLKHMNELWDPLDRSIKKPISVKGLWDQILTSNAVKPHLTSYSDFKEMLKNAYLNNDVAFRYGDYTFWLDHPYSAEVATQYYKTRFSREGRLNNWDGDVERKLSLLGVKLADVEVISPNYIIDEYIEKLKKKTMVKPGERVVRKLMVYLPDGNQDFEVFMAKYKSTKELIEALSKYPIVLVEETPPRTFNIRVVSVNGVTYSETPISIEADKSFTLTLKGTVESEEKFQIVVEVKALDEEGRVVARVEDKVRIPGDFQLQLLIERVGEFNVFVSGYEPQGYRSPELHVARVRVRGELCRDVHISGIDLAKRLEVIQEGVRVEIKSVALRGKVLRYAISHLREVLEDLARLKVVVTGSVVQKTSSGEYVEAAFRNTSASKIAKIIASLGVEEDLDVNLEFTNLTVNTLSSARLARERLLGNPLAPLVVAVIMECRKI